VTYSAASAFCESNSLSATIQHAVTLGVFCTDRPQDNPYFFSDVYFECTKSTDKFDFITGENIGFNSTGGRDGCTASAKFAPSSSASATQTISSVAITTDDTWLSVMDEACYTPYVSAAPVVSPSPTVVMNTTGPSLFPTLSPTDAPITLPINPPVAVAVPNQGGATTPTLPGRPASSSNNDNVALIGGVVGGIGAAIVIGSLIGFLVWRRKTDSGNTHKSEVSGVKYSFTEGTTGHDNLLGPAAVSATHQPSPTPVPPPASVSATQPTLPVLPASVSATQPTTSSPASVPSTNYDVGYKDQARTVINAIPAVAVTDYLVPIAVALDTSAASGASRSSQRSEPPGRVFEL
jgi:hypothetical protein